MSHTRHDRSTQILLLQSIRRDPEERGESITCSRKDVRIDYIKRSRKLDPTKTPEACRTVHCRPDAYATAVLPCSWSGPERKRRRQVRRGKERIKKPRIQALSQEWPSCPRQGTKVALKQANQKTSLGQTNVPASNATAKAYDAATTAVEIDHPPQGFFIAAAIQDGKYLRRSTTIPSCISSSRTRTSTRIYTG